MSKVGKIKNKENKRIIEEEYNEEFSFTKFIGIILIILIVLGVFYTITTLVAKKPETKEETRSSVIDEELVTISNMLSKKESDYYVLAFKSETDKKSNLNVYNMYLKDIKEKNKDFKLYRVNLGDAINKSYISDENNITNNLDEFKIKDEVLLHVVDNEIVESFVSLNQISSKLKELKGE